MDPLTASLALYCVSATVGPVLFLKACSRAAKLYGQSFDHTESAEAEAQRGVVVPFERRA